MVIFLCSRTSTGGARSDVKMRVERIKRSVWYLTEAEQKKQKKKRVETVRREEAYVV